MPNTSLDLFSQNTIRPGSLGCRAEVAAMMVEAMKRAADRGLPREEIAARMSIFLGEKVSVGTLNGYVAPSHTSQAEERGQSARDISFMRAMAFDAAIEEDVLLSLYADKIGGRRVVSREDAILLEWARLHQQEKALAERKKTIEMKMKLEGRHK